MLGRSETASDDSRLVYVALTRAQSQVIAWWAPSRDEHNGGLSRLLRDRRPGEGRIRNRCEPKTVTDEVALARFREWEAAGGPVVEESVITVGPQLTGEDAAEGSVRQAFSPHYRYHLATDLVFRSGPFGPGARRGGQRTGGGRTRR